MSFDKNFLTIFDKFGFDIQPVGVKFLTNLPDMVPRLEEKMAFCEGYEGNQTIIYECVAGEMGGMFFAASQVGCGSEAKDALNCFKDLNCTEWEEEEGFCEVEMMDVLLCLDMDIFN